MRLLIAGGGTGGHLSPALAVAQAFRSERPGDQILLAGRRGGPEESMVPAAGFDLETLAVRGLDRDAIWKNLALPWVLPAAFITALGIVDRFRPDVVLGTGAYVMAPTLLAARLRRIPYVLLAAEATGLATRLFAPGAAAVCVTFEATRERIRSRRVVVTGFPLRAGFAPGQPQAPAERLLVMGGSQGARRINVAVWEALDGLCQRFSEVIHLTGSQGQEEASRHQRPGYRPLAFTDRVAELMAHADLILCRAGVGTLAEFTAMGLPAIVVPGLFGGGHQSDNAALVAAAGAAEVVPDTELSGPHLLRVVDGLSAARLRAMAAASRSLGRPDAAARVLSVLVRVGEGVA